MLNTQHYQVYIVPLLLNFESWTNCFAEAQEISKLAESSNTDCNIMMPHPHLLCTPKSSRTDGDMHVMEAPFFFGEIQHETPNLAALALTLKRQDSGTHVGPFSVLTCRHGQAGSDFFCHMSPAPTAL